MDIIKEKIENWVKDLPSTSDTKIFVKSVDNDQFSVSLANQYNESQEISLFFDVDMNPMFVMSPLPEAESWIHSSNESLQSQTYSLDDFLELMKTTLSSLPIFNLEPEVPEVEEPGDNLYEQYVDATEDDWENIILPSIKKHIRNDKYLRNFEMEEWIRRVIKQKEDKGIKRALIFFRDEIIQHTPIPKELSKYIPRETFSPDLPMYSHNGPSGASENLKKYFHEQIIEIQRSKIPGVIVRAYNDSFHWTIEYSDFSETTQLGNDLMELALLNHDFEKSNSFRNDIFIPSNKIHPAVITFELKFKNDFPKSMPYVRLISPTLCYVSDMFFRNELKNLIYSNNEENVNNSETNEKEEEVRLEDIKLKDVIIKLRDFIVNNDLRVDLTSSVSGNNTMNGLWYTFKSCSPKTLPEFSEIEGSGRIYLPTSLLSDMYSNSFVNLRASNSGGSPMIFEIFNPVNDKKVYCGVLEFTSPEGVAILPSWVFENLEIEEPNSIEVRRVSLPKCTFLKIKAHLPEDIDQDFNVKAMLEWKLRNFLAVSTNQTIQLEERGHIFKFDVLEVKPGNYATITDLDISVELVTDKKSIDNEQTDNSETNNNKPKDLTTGYLSPSEDTKQCPNCKSFIPLSNYDLHELSCARLNTLCKKCGTVVNKKSIDAHEEEYHSFVECSKCGELIEKMYLLLHEANQCSHRLVSCKYCGMSIRLVDLPDHEEACGAITEPCENCGVRIMRKYKDEHLNSELCNKEHSTTSPKQNFNTMPLNKPNKLARSIFVCEKCQIPIEGFDELQVHYLTEHAEDEQKENMNVEEIINEELVDNNIYNNLNLEEDLE